MYEKIESCPTCNSKEFQSHLICDDHTVSQESFAIMKCSNCALLFTSPRPDQVSIGKYYQSTDYISHTDKANNLINSVYKLARNYTLRGKYSLINRLTKNKSILDYGCGTGHLLKYFSDKQWYTQGIEPDENARKIAQEQGINVSELLSLLPKTKYDVITLWHVLEHIHDITTTLENLHKLLHKDGSLVIAVPNYDSKDQQIYKQHWAAYDVPRHLYHFNQLTIKELMKYNGFKLASTHPMKLDAYYVSMLSEKNKYGKTNYLKSILNGWLSNRWAKNNNNNYSSLIYVFKKS